MFIAYYLLFPALLCYLCLKFPALDRVGLVLLCFAMGIVGSVFFDILPNLNGTTKAASALQTQISEAAIAVALPLLLFSMDFNAAFKLAKSCALAMALALLSIVSCCIILSVVFAPYLEHTWQVAGLAVGAYTGGGPNMAAIHSAIESHQSVFITMTSYDILLSAIYLLVAISILKPIASRFLRPFNPAINDIENERQGHADKFAHLEREGAAAYLSLCSRTGLVKCIQALGLSALAVLASVGIAGLFPTSMQSAGTIILITTLGAAASFIPTVRNLKQSFHLGMYLILIFCFTMGNATDIRLFLTLDFTLFSFIGALLIASLIVHALLCRLCKIDADTYVISASAAIMSVPFMPVVSSAINNRALLVPGLAIAIVGYVLGNYLGIATALSLRALLGL